MMEELMISPRVKMDGKPPVDASKARTLQEQEGSGRPYRMSRVGHTFMADEVASLQLRV